MPISFKDLHDRIMTVHYFWRYPMLLSFITDHRRMFMNLQTKFFVIHYCHHNSVFSITIIYFFEAPWYFKRCKITLNSLIQKKLFLDISVIKPTRNIILYNAKLLDVNLHVCIQLVEAFIRGKWGNNTWNNFTNTTLRIHTWINIDMFAQFIAVFWGSCMN